MALALALKLTGTSKLIQQKISERNAILTRWNREINGDGIQKQDKTGYLKLGENMAWIELILEDEFVTSVKDITVEVSIILEEDDNDAGIN